MQVFILLIKSCTVVLLYRLNEKIGYMYNITLLHKTLKIYSYLSLIRGMEAGLKVNISKTKFIVVSRDIYADDAYRKSW